MSDKATLFILAIGTAAFCFAIVLGLILVATL